MFDMFDEEKFYTVSQIVKIIPVCKKTIYDNIKRKTLSAHNISNGKRKHLLIKGSELNEYFIKNKL